MHPQPIEIKNREGFIALLERIGDSSLAQDYFIVAGDGKTYFNSEVKDLSEPPFDRKYPNLPLRSAIENKNLRQIIITGEIPSVSAKDEVHRLFRCPITFDITPLPIITPSGQAYDQQGIHESISRVGPRDPNTRLPLSQADLLPNEALRDLLLLYASIDNSVLEVVKERLEELRDAVQETQTRLNEIERELQKYNCLRIGGVLSAVAFYASGCVTAFTTLGDYITEESGPLIGAGLVLGVFGSVLCIFGTCAKISDIKERLQAEKQSHETALSARRLLFELEHGQLGTLADEVVIDVGETAGQTHRSAPTEGRNPLGFFAPCCCCSSEHTEESTQRLLPE